MKVNYSCDICRDHAPKADLHGIHFLNMKKFDIRDAASTDGIHICIGCLTQLAEQAGPALARRLPSKPREQP